MYFPPFQLLEMCRSINAKISRLQKKIHQIKQKSFPWKKNEQIKHEIQNNRINSSCFSFSCRLSYRKASKNFFVSTQSSTKKHLYKFIISFKANDGMEHNKFRRQKEIWINITTSKFLRWNVTFKWKMAHKQILKLFISND